MVRVVVVALFAAAVLSGCSTPNISQKTAAGTGKATVISSYVTVEGAARMLAAKGVMAKWKTAEQLCNEAGHPTGTASFVRCFTAYQSFALRATRARAKALTDEVARHYGLCIDRTRFEIGRCQEI